MGMSASQARYLGLVARMNNLEYQGQQINQERTVLSQQCTALYNSLLDMQVPTPPSTSDYTKVVYSGADGASTFTIGSVIPHNGTYSIDFQYSKTGHYVTEAGTAAARGVPAKLKLTVETSPITTATNYFDITSSAQHDLSSYTYGGSGVDTIMEYVGLGGSIGSTGSYYMLQGSKFIEVSNPDAAECTGKKIFVLKDNTTYSGASAVDQTEDYLLGNDTSIMTPKKGYGYQKVDLANSYYVIENGAFRSVKDSDFATSTSDTTSLFLLNDDGTYRMNSSYGAAIAKRSTAEVVPDDASGAGIYTNAERTDLIGVVADKNCYTVKTAANLGLISSDSLVSYIEALRNAFPADTEGKTDDEVSELFGVYFSKDSNTGRNVPHFVYTNEVLSSIGDVTSTHYLTTYDYIANGKYTDIDHKDNCLLTFDAQGRITDVKIPVEYAADGTVATYKTVHLSAETTTDSAAYEEAYNQYEYAQLIYDKKQQEINAKTEIIQQEDRNLELKLTRLDNERKAIDTELDAVKKVIEDNIESSYKTFSG